MKRRTPIIPDSSKRKFSQQVESLSQSERAVLSIVGELPLDDRTEMPVDEQASDRMESHAELDVQTSGSIGRLDLSDVQTFSSTERLDNSDVRTSGSSGRPDQPDVRTSGSTGRSDAQTSERPTESKDNFSETDVLPERKREVYPGRPDVQPSGRPGVSSIPVEVVPDVVRIASPTEQPAVRKAPKKPALKETGQKITIYLEPDVVMKAKIQATMEKSTMSELIGKVLKEHFSSK